VKTPTTRAELDALKQALAHHDRLYYVEAQPEISDREYDALYKALVDAEAAHPEWVTADSPTRRVSESPLGGFETVRHSTPMLSIDNGYSLDELREFDARVRKALDVASVDYVVELKIDGVAIVLRFEEGRFARGITRGDGAVGDDVTQNLRTLKGLPLDAQGTGDGRMCAARSTWSVPASTSSTPGARPKAKRRTRTRATPRPARSRCSMRARWHGGKLSYFAYAVADPIALGVSRQARRARPAQGARAARQPARPARPRARGGVEAEIARWEKARAHARLRHRRPRREGRRPRPAAPARRHLQEPALGAGVQVRDRIGDDDAEGHSAPGRPHGRGHAGRRPRARAAARHHTVA
jgi:hypothetical protein